MATAPVSIAPREHPAPLAISQRRKAAIIVRLLVSEGAKLPLDTLPGPLQTALTSEIGSMRYIDSETLRAVISEFMEELEKVGLTFPGGLDGALSLLDGHISSEAVSELKAGRPRDAPPDPWPPIAAHDTEDLLPLLNDESTEVSAVLLSKLSTPKAAELLGMLPGEQARRIAYAVSMTAQVSPEIVERIGHILLEQLQCEPQVAFSHPPEDRIGAILNLSTARTRDDIIASLEETDEHFATRVRKSIFTFSDIPARVMPRDVPAIARDVDPDVLIVALKGALEMNPEAAEFILSNMSQRVAGQLREDIAERAAVPPTDAETAMTQVVTTLRELEAEGQITLIKPEEDEG